MRWYDGHWVVTHPGKGRRHGYAISQMDKHCVQVNSNISLKMFGSMDHGG